MPVKRKSDSFLGHTVYRKPMHRKIYYTCLPALTITHHRNMLSISILTQNISTDKSNISWSLSDRKVIVQQTPTGLQPHVEVTFTAGEIGQGVTIPYMHATFGRINRLLVKFKPLCTFQPKRPVKDNLGIKVPNKNCFPYMNVVWCILGRQAMPLRQGARSMHSRYPKINQICQWWLNIALRQYITSTSRTPWYWLQQGSTTFSLLWASLSRATEKN
jgi:hypothetical protein